jgi:hypothetical protein
LPFAAEPGPVDLSVSLASMGGVRGFRSGRAGGDEQGLGLDLEYAHHQELEGKNEESAKVSPHALGAQ